MLHINNITKDFQSFRVLNNVSLTIGKNQILGILGPNGAGKTTLLRVLTGLLVQNSGSIESTDGPWPKIGFKPERLHFPDNMTVRQYISMMASMSGFARSEVAQAADQVIQLVGMVSAQNHKIKQCSKGMRQRIGLAQAMLGNPDLIILDEPGDGLDPIGQQEMRSILQMLKEQGKSILLSTHRLNDVKALCTDIAILSHGEIVYSSSISKVLETSSSTKIICDSDLEDITSLLESLNSEITIVGNTVELKGGALALRRDVLRLLLSAGYDVLRIEKPEASLNEIYSKMIRK